MKKLILLLTLICIGNLYAQHIDQKLIDINRFKMPIDNKGVLADVLVDPQPFYGKYDEATVLWSGGFGLSGYDNGEIWSNAVISASRIEDYQTGIVGSDKDDEVNKVYEVKSSDTPFGQSWLTWKDAVSLGAKFYDGDGDRIYNPIDLNSNGVWDENEDCPDLLGDVTTWTVFNDGVPSALRRFSVEPKNIEIRQTVFAYSPETYEELDGVIFIRYVIENKSSNNYDSVYFSCMTDPDIGNPNDDLVGCDTNLNAGYAYNDGEDEEYGHSPSFLATIIQGAPVYIAGETYTDNNGNDIYDESIDTPLDTANYFNGQNINKVEFVGAKNQNMNSFTQYMSSHPTQGDPDTHLELRGYMLGGHDSYGDSIYVSDWKYGNGDDLGTDSLNTPAHFMYSGDPLRNEGWINTTAIDQRMMANSGPFTLKQNEPVEIIVAYVVGRGSTSVRSIDVTKGITRDVIGFYNSNFSFVPVGVKDKFISQLPIEYSLQQNYPNPFNPSTQISYQIPKNGFVNLVVYNTLGQVVSELVNEHQTKGKYSVQFNATGLSSGVYFYKIESSNFTKVNKMLLLK